jgi:hypothetical protein
LEIWGDRVVKHGVGAITLWGKAPQPVIDRLAQHLESGAAQLRGSTTTVEEARVTSSPELFDRNLLVRRRPKASVYYVGFGGCGLRLFRCLGWPSHQALTTLPDRQRTKMAS